MIKSLAAAPAGEVLAVKQRNETGRRSCGRSRGREAARYREAPNSKHQAPVKHQARREQIRNPKAEIRKKTDIRRPRSEISARLRGGTKRRKPSSAGTEPRVFRISGF